KPSRPAGRGGVAMIGDLTPAVSVARARRAVAAAFRDAGLDTPELDARVLIGHALGLDHAGLVAQAERILGRDSAERIPALAVPRLRGPPPGRCGGAAASRWPASSVTRNSGACRS